MDLICAMTTMCLNLISCHLMQHSLDQRGHHQLEMGFNTLTFTYPKLCSVKNKFWDLFWISFLRTNMMAILQGMGFESGWGDTAQRVSEMVHLLLEILQAPDPSTLETFLGRIPMVFNVVIVAPHGYFGQANVLGLPDTGGQVVYILDQVRALENEMLLRIQNQGLGVIPKILIVTRLIPDAKGTTCNQRLEESVVQNTHISYGYLSGLRMEFCGNGFHGLMCGLTWRPSQRMPRMKLQLSCKVFQI